MLGDANVDSTTFIDTVAEVVVVSHPRRSRVRLLANAARARRSRHRPCRRHLDDWRRDSAGIRGLACQRTTLLRRRCPMVWPGVRSFDAELSPGNDPLS